jgi:WGR domain
MLQEQDEAARGGQECRCAHLHDFNTEGGRSPCAVGCPCGTFPRHRGTWLDVQLDLFGAWCFIRGWGRIGQAGQTRTVPFPTPAEAQAALDRPLRKKERKGYA